MTYRYVGAGTDLGNGIVLERFGQQIELEQAIAESLVLYDNVALVPDAAFRARGFTADELKEWYAVALHVSAPATFIAKRDGIWSDLLAWREKLKNPAHAEEKET